MLIPVKMITVCLVLLSTMCCQQAAAWGAQGHAVVASIAEANLSAPAKAAVARLLRDDLDKYGKPSHRHSLVAVASWADEIRSTPKGRANSRSHYRSNSVCDKQLGPCARQQCIDAKLQRMIARLRSGSGSERQQNEALKWVVHFVGDIHQPLHVAAYNDRGGNDLSVVLVGVKTKGRQTLHKVWDTALVHLALQQGPLRAKLATDYQPGSVSDWMQEGRILSRDIAYGALPGFSCQRSVIESSPLFLDRSYQQQAIETIRHQLIQAGLRLAWLLNDIYGPSSF